MKFDANSDIWAIDELTLYRAADNHGMSKEEILATPGMFYLKDLVISLDLDMNYVNRALESFKGDYKAIYEQMGMAKLWGGWVVRMKVFAEFCRHWPLERTVTVLRIPHDWDANTLMRAKGIYSLTQVCRHLPFSARQLRYRCRQNPNAKEVYGIWKDDNSNRFLVDMEVFSEWIRRLWRGNGLSDEAEHDEQR